MRIPVVERVAPQLAGLGEVVGRHAGDHGGVAGLVEVEQLRVGPDVGAVVGDEDRGVPDDPQPQAPGPTPQRRPLPEEHELPEHVAVGQVGEPVPGRSEGVGVAPDQLGGPVGPRPSALVVLDRHEQRVVVQPIRLGLPERSQFLAEAEAGSGGEGVVRPVEHGQLPGDDGAVVDAALGERRPVLEVCGGQQPGLGQQLGGDEVGVACERREALVRRVAVPGGTEGEHLPQRGTGRRQPVHPRVGFRAQVADPVRPGEAGRMQDDPGSPVEVHGGASYGRRPARPVATKAQ